MQAPLKLQMMFGHWPKSHRIFKRLTRALIRLRICAGWSESLLVAHTTLLAISCCGSIIEKKTQMLDMVTVCEIVHFFDQNSKCQSCQNTHKLIIITVIMRQSSRNCSQASPSDVFFLYCYSVFLSKSSKCR